VYAHCPPRTNVRLHPLGTLHSTPGAGPVNPSRPWSLGVQMSDFAVLRSTGNHTMPQPETDPTAMLDNQADPPVAEEVSPATPPVPEIPPVPSIPEPDKEVLVEGIPIGKYMELKQRERETEQRIRQLEQQLQQRQQPQQPQDIPDPLVDPQGYAAFLAQHNQQQQAMIE